MTRITLPTLSKEWDVPYSRLRKIIHDVFPSNEWPAKNQSWRLTPEQVETIKGAYVATYGEVSSTSGQVRRNFCLELAVKLYTSDRYSEANPYSKDPEHRVIEIAGVFENYLRQDQSS